MNQLGWVSSSLEISDRAHNKAVGNSSVAVTMEEVGHWISIAADIWSLVTSSEQQEVKSFLFFCSRRGCGVEKLPPTLATMPRLCPYYLMSSPSQYQPGSRKVDGSVNTAIMSVEYRHHKAWSVPSSFYISFSHSSLSSPLFASFVSFHRGSTRYRENKSKNRGNFTRTIPLKFYS